MAPQSTHSRSREAASGSPGPDRLPHGRHVVDLDGDEARHLLEALVHRDGQTTSPAALPRGAGGPAAALALARLIGNRRFGQLSQPARTGPDVTGANPVVTREPDTRSLTPAWGGEHDETQADLARAPQEGAEVIRRQAQGGRIRVSLTFNQAATVYHDVQGETMQEVCEAMPSVIGEFRYEDQASLGYETTPEGDTWVNRVTIPVSYYYHMPRWPQLASQPAKIKQAWAKFYSDVLKHEQEHLGVCRKHYTELKTALEGLRGEDRYDARVYELASEAMSKQDAIHESHAGFATPAIIDPCRYVPSP